MGSAFGLKFWGTRGLISSPRQATAKYGGSTTCMQVVCDDILLAVDCGFGIANWGELLMEDILVRKRTLDIHILFTHFHWDHIQGLPFFHPIYFPQTRLFLYSPNPRDVMFKSLDILFDGSYSPFSGIASMPSRIELLELKDALNIGPLAIDYTPVDHGRDITTQMQSSCYAYRIDHDNGKNITIATDHEARTSATNQNFIDFAQGAGLLVHDGQYTEDEYRKHVGWGHSTARQALANAQATGAASLLVTHHAPHRDDDEIDAIKASLVQEAAPDRHLNVEFAREGHTYEAMHSANPGKKTKAS